MFPTVVKVVAPEEKVEWPCEPGTREELLHGGVVLLHVNHERKWPPFL